MNGNNMFTLARCFALSQILIATICVQCCYCDETFQVKAGQSYSLRLSADRFAYGQCRDGHVIISPTNPVSDAPEWHIDVPGETRSFSVNDTISCAYFVTTDGLFYCDLREKRPDEKVLGVKRILLPKELELGTLEVFAVTNDVAFLCSHDQLALASTEQCELLHKIQTSFFVNAVGRSGLLLYSPGEDCDLRLLLPQTDLSETFHGTRVTAIGMKSPCQSYLRVVQAGSDFSVFAGIVSYFSSSKCPKRDALFVWGGFTLLDVDRTLDFDRCTSLAIYGKTICAALRPDAENQQTLVVNFQVSDVIGLHGRSQVELPFVGESPVMLHPKVPLALRLSKDRSVLDIDRIEIDGKENGSGVISPGH